MDLKVWRLHPEGCRIAKAEKTVFGTANKAATKWCAPYSQANSLGWHLWPPSDVDIMWKGPKTFEYRHISEYSDYDYHFVRGMLKSTDNADPDKWCIPGGRTKFTWGAADDDVVQIWTGIILQTPPGWCLQIRSPINCELPHRFYNLGAICSVQEGILETDWMQYDLWINLKFHVRNKWVYLRRVQQFPIAQIVPVKRETMGEWSIQESAVNRETPEGEKVFKYWVDYNQRKFASGGKQRLSADDPSLVKDSTTYYRKRKEALGCPFLAKLAEQDLQISSGQESPVAERHDLMPRSDAKNVEDLPFSQNLE